MGVGADSSLDASLWPSTAEPPPPQPPCPSPTFPSADGSLCRPLEASPVPQASSQQPVAVCGRHTGPAPGPPLCHRGVAEAHVHWALPPDFGLILEALRSFPLTLSVGSVQRVVHFSSLKTRTFRSVMMPGALRMSVGEGAPGTD